jgi:hypothetical protein
LGAGGAQVKDAELRDAIRAALREDGYYSHVEHACDMKREYREAAAAHAKRRAALNRARVLMERLPCLSPAA